MRNRLLYFGSGGLGALLSLVTASALTAQAQPPRASLALVGGTLIDGFGGPALRNSVVLVDGERIVAVGTWDR